MSENITDTVTPESGFAHGGIIVRPEGSTDASDSIPLTPVTPVEPEAAEKLTAEQLRSALDAARKDAAKYRTRWQEAKPIVEAHEAAEEANKTELQRAQDQLQAIADERDALERQVIVSDLARTHNLTEEDINFLGSGTREELEARAQYLGALRATVAPDVPKAPPTDRPVESLRPGASPQPQPVEDNSYPAAWRSATRERS
ncbi:hypothetical protein [Rhodococcus jostii]|uniref:hypothetical protein n=1 Tax=Rhodococcus jostii TaxID=132919 RepID=UPI003636B795